MTVPSGKSAAMPEPAAIEGSFLFEERGGFIEEYVFADASFTDGLREAVGDEVIKIVSELKLDLEQDEADREEKLERKESAAAEAAGASEDEQCDPVSPPATSTPATAGASHVAPDPTSA